MHDGQVSIGQTASRSVPGMIPMKCWTKTQIPLKHIYNDYNLHR